MNSAHHHITARKLIRRMICGALTGTLVITGWGALWPQWARAQSSQGQAPQSHSHNQAVVLVRGIQGDIQEFSARLSSAVLKKSLILSMPHIESLSLPVLNKTSFRPSLAEGLYKITFDTGSFNKNHNSTSTAQRIADELLEAGLVEWAQPDYPLFLQVMPEFDRSYHASSSLSESLSQLGSFGFPLAPSVLSLNDPMLGELWGMMKILAPQAWELSRGQQSVIVADIDTGVDYTHEDLRDNMWTNPDSGAGDRFGYDFADVDADPMDTHGHGTHTSGTIGARANNRLGVVGVTHDVKIMALRFIGSNGQGTTSGAIQSIDYAVQHGARVINASWGGYVNSTDPEDVEQNKLLKDAIERAGDSGVLFVAAVGNDGLDADREPIAPACFDSDAILTVASTTFDDRRSFFSNFGQNCVDVGAPGSAILSTVPGNKYTKYNGTSMAAPHVAGLAALLLAKNPRLTVAELKALIMESGDTVAGLQGKSVSGKRINAKSAFQRSLVGGRD